MEKSKQKQKLEIIIFIILLFLQNFAIINTKEFGIAAITIFLIYLFIKHRMYQKIDKKSAIIVASIVLFVVISQLLNKAFNFLQIGRYSMILFIGWTSIKYMEKIQEMNQKDFFNKVFYFALIILTGYGVYQLIASKLQMPMFFNIFNNNPSYGARGLFESYSGWTRDIRIYTTFYEPSAYAIFLTIAYFYAMTFGNLDKDKKFTITVLTLFNIFFTYSRSGWVVFAYYIAIYIAFKLFKNNKPLMKLTKIGIILLPLITLAIMSTLGIYVFKDASSTARTYSSLYYLVNSFNSIKGILIGHGLGSMLRIPEGLEYKGYVVETFSHNGYIDIVYQLGIPFFIIMIYAIIKYLKGKKIEDEWLIYATIFTLCCSGSMYSVESIIAIVCLVIGDFKLREHKKIEQTDNMLKENKILSKILAIIKKDD